MRGDGAAGNCLCYIFKLRAELFDKLFDLFNGFGVDLGVSDKYAFKNDVVAVAQAVGDVVHYNLFDAAAIFFGGGHLAVNDLDAGL